MSKQNELVELARTGASGGGNKNLVINGSMQVAQRGTSATVSNGSNEGYSTVDRFYLNFNAGVAGAINFSQSSDAPSGFANSIKMQCSTTNTSFATTNAINLEYRPEAQDLQRLGYGTSDAKKMTISWYMKAVNFSDPISLALETRDGTAEYFVKSYTPTTSWVRYTCTVPESTSATINDDNGQGIFVKFVIAGFSSGTYAVSADSTAWSTTRADYVDDIGNFTSSTSNELYITGVQMELGEKATDFEHRSFGDELARCQRYYQIIAGGVGIGASSTSIETSFTRKEMRAAPSGSIIGSPATAKFEDPTVGNKTQSTGGVLITTASARSEKCQFTNFSGLISTRSYFMKSDKGLLALDAEL
jgi:hypothetical protein